MRRLSTLFLAVGLVFLVAHQAGAYQVKIGMRIMTDVYYAFQSGTSYEDSNVNQPDLTRFHAGMARANYMRFDFVSPDKTTGARIQINIQGGFAHGDSAVILHTMFGWYKFGRCMLAVGHRPNLFAPLSYSPYQSLGFTGRDSVGRLGPWFKFIGFGKQFGGRFVQVALYYMYGPWKLMACVGQASANNAMNAQYGGNAGALVTNTPAPRVDLAVEYKGKHFSVAPGAAFYYTRLEPMEGTYVDDQNVLSFMLVLPFHVNFGRFGFKGEVSFGQNWDTANHNPLVRQFNRAVYWGGTNDDGNRIKVKDTRIYAACLGLYYRIGRVTLWLSGGWHRSENGSGDVAGGWRHGQQTRYAFVFAAPYRVNKHFTIAPEVGYWYQGWDPRQDVGGSTDPADPTSMTANLGSFWLAGIQFIIQF